MPLMNDYSETLVFDSEQDQQDSVTMITVEWKTTIEAIQDCEIELAEIAAEIQELGASRNSTWHIDQQERQAVVENTIGRLIWMRDHSYSALMQVRRGVIRSNELQEEVWEA